jgi:autotransporter-associated beta strand protein
LYFGGAATLAGNSTLDFDLTSAQADLLALNGSLGVSGVPTINFRSTGNLSGPYTLATFGFSSLTASDFHLVGLPAGYSFNVDPTDLTIVPLPLTISTWATATSGSWATAGKWTPVGVPNGVAAGVIINPATAVPLNITLDGPRTVGSLVFGNSSGVATGYTFVGSGSNTLTMNNSGYGVATITVTDGVHHVAAPVVLAGDLLVTPAAGSSLSIDGNVSQSGGDFALTLGSTASLSSTGELVLLGNNTYNGGTKVLSGILDVKSAGGLYDGSSLTVGNFDSYVPHTASAGGAPAAATPGVAAVPEPGTIALLVAGALCGLAGWVRRRRNS